MAGGGGFEPPLAEPKSAVLPLDDPPELWNDEKGLPVLFLPGRAVECKPFVYGALVRPGLVPRGGLFGVKDFCSRSFTCGSPENMKVYLPPHPNFLPCKRVEGDEDLLVGENSYLKTRNF